MQPADIVFDPHVAFALLLVFVALIVVFVVAITPNLPQQGERK